MIFIKQCSIGDWRRILLSKVPSDSDMNTGMTQTFHKVKGKFLKLFKGVFSDQIFEKVINGKWLSQVKIK